MKSDTIKVILSTFTALTGIGGSYWKMEDRVSKLEQEMAQQEKVRIIEYEIASMKRDEELQELILKQTAKAPENYQGFEDMQVESELVPKVAEGGVMDLRQGGMSLGPGTEKSDDIPAMLSDGEFVLTARAVRGIGDGSRAAGAKKLYQFMNQAEQNVPS